MSNNTEELIESIANIIDREWNNMSSFESMAKTIIESLSPAPVVDVERVKRLDALTKINPVSLAKRYDKIKQLNDVDHRGYALAMCISILRVDKSKLPQSQPTDEAKRIEEAVEMVEHALGSDSPYDMLYKIKQKLEE